MSTPSEEPQRVRTRGGGKEKMKNVVALLRSGGEQASEETVAKQKPTKKRQRSKPKDPEQEAAIQTVKAVKLAEIEDNVAKQVKAAKSAHPRRRNGKSAASEQAPQNGDNPKSGQENDIAEIQTNEIELADTTVEYEEENIQPMSPPSTQAIRTRQQNILGMHLLAALTKQHPSKPKPRAAYKKDRPFIGEATSNQRKASNAEVRTHDMQDGVGFISQQVIQSARGSPRLPAAQDLTAAEPVHTLEADLSPDLGGGRQLEDDSMDEVEVAAAGDEHSDSDYNVAANTNRTRPNVVKADGPKEKPKLRDQVLANRIEASTKGFQRKASHSDEQPDGRTKTTVGFSTPVTKKNIANCVQEWVQTIPPPPIAQAAKKLKISSASSVVTSSSSILLPKTKGSRSSAVVLKTTTDVLGKRPESLISSERTAREIDSDSEDEQVPTTVYGGLQEEDDTEEQRAATLSPMKAPIAAKKSKANIKVKAGLSTGPNTKKTVRQFGNKDLPNGALNNGKWAIIYISTYLRHLGGINKNVWTLGDGKAIRALQAIWNAVYNGRNGDKRIVHVVKRGESVHKIAMQRATEWRNAIGSTGLIFVNDFFDSLELQTTEERRNAAIELLEGQKYAYQEYREVENNGVPEVKKRGRYRNALILYTFAQHLIDTEDGIDVPDLMGSDDFPKAALVLSATAVHRALWLWAGGYITYESYIEAKGTKLPGIIKLVRPDGKLTKGTNFSKERWEDESDRHILDVWSLDDGRLNLIMEEARAAQEVIQGRNAKLKRKVQDEAASSSRKRARDDSYRPCLHSDSDF